MCSVTSEVNYMVTAGYRRLVSKKWRMWKDFFSTDKFKTAEYLIWHILLQQNVPKF